MAACPIEPSPSRIRSIDVVRGLTILVMMFVNDLAGVKDAPRWMKHVQPPDADGMTFVDVVFPAFLFIVGMSIPFALAKRREGGSAWGHVLLRAVSLIAIGVLMVNTETMAEGGPLSKPVWSLLMYVGVALVWLPWPSRVAWLRGLGGAGIVGLAFLYRGNEVDTLVQLRPQWWGILGLIGWAYLVAAAAFLLARERLAPLLGLTCLLYLMYAANQGGAFAGFNEVVPWIDLGGALGSHAALTLSGAVLGVMIRRASAAGDLTVAVRQAFGFGIGMALAAWLLHAAADLHPMFRYNKIAATPAWCLLSAAYTTWIWAITAWLTDVKMYRRGCGWLSMAGQNALLAYILAPVAYLLLDLGLGAVGIANPYWGWGDTFAGGLARAIGFAVGITWLAAWLMRRKVVLRL